MRFHSILSISLLALSGCGVVAEKTNFLSDDDVRAKSARAAGYEPSEVQLISRTTEGTNTYAVIRAKGNKTFSCILNGGNALTMGIVNPPSCVRK